MFLNFVLPKIATINQYFQSDKIIISKLHSVMVQSYKEILLFYVQRQYVINSDIEIIDPANKTWFLPTKVFRIKSSQRT